MAEPAGPAHVVVGGGITGLFSAHLLAERDPATPVIVVERDVVPGGLLRSHDYPGLGRFDYGIHAFYETGVPAIDDYLIGLHDDWRFHEGHARDLGGASLGGRTNLDAPYLDLRDHPKAGAFRAEIDALVAACDCAPGQRCDPSPSARALFEAKFGPSLTDAVLAPVIEARQHLPADAVDPLAAALLGLGRVVLFEEEEVRRRYREPRFSSRIAFPDQRRYPDDLLTGRRAFYPRRPGIGAVIRRMVEDLEDRGVRVLTGTGLAAIERRGRRIEAVRLATPEGDRRVGVASLVCAVPLPAVARFLPEIALRPPARRPHRTLVCNIVTREAPADGGVHYVYLHGHKRAHRASFLRNYSGPRAEGHAICVELVYPDGHEAGDARTQATGALVGAGLVTDPDAFVHADVQAAPGGFPDLSLAATESLRGCREQVDALGIENLGNVGVLSRDDLFFQFDLLRHAEAVLS